MITTLIHELTIVPLWFYPAALMASTVIALPIGLFITKDWN